jgi:hypothetical protein
MQLKLVTLLTVLILAHLNPLAQVKRSTTAQHKQLYENAFLEITQMLQGAKPVSFKRAVFLAENAFLNGSWTYERFNRQIANISIKLKQLIRERHLEGFKTASNWAVFTYMTDSIVLNNFKPYKYDFDNFLPDKDPTVRLVTKLLSTNKGNCNSLPFLYKILAEEIGGTAYLVLAPIHCYIKHKDEKGKWVNLEMTSGSFARDEWIMQQSGVTVEQIKSGIYMNALTQKESLALVLKELAANYQFQFGVGDFDLKVVDTALKYYTAGVNLYMVKFEHYRQNLLAARKLNDKVLEEKYYKMLHKLDQRLIELAYKEPSKGDYEEWVKENENR